MFALEPLNKAIPFLKGVESCIQYVFKSPFLFSCAMVRNSRWFREETL